MPGATTERGAAGIMAGVTALVEPAAPLSAVTSQVSVWPMSAAVIVYWAAVAPSIATALRRQR